jgi:hypothetical protein
MCNQMKLAKKTANQKKTEMILAVGLQGVTVILENHRLTWTERMRIKCTKTC